MVQLSNKLAYTIISIIALSLLGIFVYAQNQGGNFGVTPNPGHSISQIGTPAGCSPNQFLKWSEDGWVCSNVGGGGGGENIWTLSENNIYYNDGNVGVGTDNPSQKLDVRGNIRFSYGGILGVTQDNNWANTKILETGWENNKDFLKIYTAGQGAGNANPKITILNDGNVGIGTTTPQQKLNVLGDVNFTGILEIGGQIKIKGGNPSAGKILISNAEGLASWETLQQCTVVPLEVSCPSSPIQTTRVRWYATSTTGERSGQCGGFSLSNCPGYAYAPRDGWYTNPFCCIQQNAQGYTLNSENTLCCSN